MALELSQLSMNVKKKKTPALDVRSSTSRLNKIMCGISPQKLSKETHFDCVL